VIESGYELEITMRFRVQAGDQEAGRALAERFAERMYVWLDASGVPSWTPWTMVTRSEPRPLETTTESWGIWPVTEEDLAGNSLFREIR
jgi:hypothetical protein